VFINKTSGKLARQPELDNALHAARAGDQLVITKLHRLGRSLEHLIDLSNGLQQRNVDLIVLEQGIDTSTALGRMFFQILGSIARVRTRPHERAHAAQSSTVGHGQRRSRGQRHHRLHRGPRLPGALDCSTSRPATRAN